jgi:hypothetical protein
MIADRESSALRESMLPLAGQAQTKLMPLMRSREPRRATRREID